jgi:hypothetical protein
LNINDNNGDGKVIDIDTLLTGWDASQQLTAVYHPNKQDIIRELKRQNIEIYNGILEHFITSLENDTILWNQFNASVNLPVLPNKTANITINGDYFVVSDNSVNMEYLYKKLKNGFEYVEQ